MKQRKEDKKVSVVRQRDQSSLRQTVVNLSQYLIIVKKVGLICVLLPPSWVI